jgi:hypothetical protein
MANLSLEHILLSIVFTSGGTIGGWALTGKLGGGEAASSFLKLGIIVVLVMSTAQFMFFSLGKNRLIYRIVFNIAFGCGLVWFMLCLLLPIIWVQKVGNIEKWVLFLFLVALCVANIFKGCTQFKLKWGEAGEGALGRHVNIKEGTVDWPKVLAPMKFSVELYIPGIPGNLNPFISLAIILFMLTGLSLRNVFPTFSLLAWGIPSCLVISIFMQLIGLGIAQIAKLVALEKQYGKIIRPKI